MIVGIIIIAIAIVTIGILMFMLHKRERISQEEIQSKLDVGDWVVSPNGVYWHVDAIRDDRYQVSANSGECADWPLNTNIYHKFTIQDAKDGDILCTYECDEPKIVFILKGTPKKHYALGYHCYYNIMYPHFESDSENGCLGPNDEDVKPATKDQSDLLFQKMKVAGYVWNSYNKELKKIEQPSIEVPDVSTKPKFIVDDIVVETDSKRLYKILEVCSYTYVMKECGNGRTIIIERGFAERNYEIYNIKEESKDLHINGAGR